MVAQREGVIVLITDENEMSKYHRNDNLYMSGINASGINSQNGI